MNTEKETNIKDEAKTESKAVSLCEKLLKYKKSTTYTTNRTGSTEETKHMSSIFKTRKFINEVLSPDKEVTNMAMEMLANRIISRTYHKYDLIDYEWKPLSDGKGFVLSVDVTNFERYY